MSRRILIGAAVVFVTAVCAVFFWPDGQQPLTGEQHYQAAIRMLDSGERDSRQLEAAFAHLQKHGKYERHLAVADAVLFLRSGKYQEAIERLATVPKGSAVREDALRYAGETLYHMDRKGDAEQVFRTLKAEFPDNTDASRWLGVIYYDLGAYDPAIAELETVISREPENFVPHQILGVMHTEFEAFEDAIKHFRNALERKPPDKPRNEIQLELARSLISNRQQAEAVKLLSALPESVERLQLEARCAYAQGQASETSALLERAEALGSLDEDGRELKAEVALNKGDAKEGIRILEELLKSRPARQSARYKLALALQQAGEKERGQELLDDWKARKSLTDEMIQLNLKAVAEPANADVRDQLAEICHKLGREDLAEMWSKAAAASRESRAPIEISPEPEL